MKNVSFFSKIAKINTQIVKVVHFDDLQIELKCLVNLQDMFLFAQPIYLLQKHLCGYLYWEVGVFLDAEGDLHGLVLEVETGDVSPE